jgi:hypothetical protein
MILFRLMKDGKVVGYEKHIYREADEDSDADMTIWHAKPNKHYWHILAGNYIPHDRKDRYTGIDVDGEKLFERDILYDEMAKGRWVIEWDASGDNIGRWIRRSYPKKELRLRSDFLSNNKIIGIEGAANEKSD